jgi:hypothetical protein
MNLTPKKLRVIRLPARKDACYSHQVTQPGMQLWRTMKMAATTSTTPAREPATRSTAASKDVAGKAPEHPVPTAAAAAEPGSDMLQTMSQMIYSGSYALAYGVVYAAVFVAQSLPHENPVMHGLRDGGQAAVDELRGS